MYFHLFHFRNQKWERIRNQYFTQNNQNLNAPFVCFWLHLLMNMPATVIKPVQQNQMGFFAPFGSILNFEFSVSAFMLDFAGLSFSAPRRSRLDFFLNFIFSGWRLSIKSAKSCFMVLGHKMGISIYFNKLTRRQLKVLLRYSPFKVIVCFLNHDAQRTKSSQQEWPAIHCANNLFARKNTWTVHCFLPLKNLRGWFCGVEATTNSLCYYYHKL